jgi:hypothetical protein
MFLFLSCHGNIRSPRFIEGEIEKEGNKFKKKETKRPRRQKCQVLINSKSTTNRRKGRERRRKGRGKRIKGRRKL